MPPTLKKPPQRPVTSGRAESIVDFVSREGIGLVMAEPQQGGRFWFHCKRCWNDGRKAEFDKYQDLRKHAREEHGWQGKI